MRKHLGTFTKVEPKPSPAVIVALVAAGLFILAAVSWVAVVSIVAESRAQHLELNV